MSTEKAENVFLTQNNMNSVSNDLNMDDHSISNISLSETSSSAVTKKFVDNLVHKRITKQEIQHHDINMNNKLIFNVKDDSELNNVATKKYITQNFLEYQEPLKYPLDLKNHRVINTECTDDNALANKKYCNDTYVNKNERFQPQHDVSMENHNIINIPQIPLSNTSCVAKKYILQFMESFLSLKGGVFSGNLNVNNNNIVNLKDSSQDSSLCTKRYVDRRFTRGEIGGSVVLKNKHITDLKTPILNSHGANKDYLDKQPNLVYKNTNFTGPLKCDIKHINTPTLSHQAANYNYFIEKTKEKIRPTKNHGSKFFKDENIKKIINLKTPTLPTHIATKKYCEDRKNNIEKIPITSFGTVNPPVHDGLTVQFVPTSTSTELRAGNHITKLTNSVGPESIVIPQTADQPIMGFDYENNKYFIGAHPNGVNTPVTIPTNKLFSSTNKSTMIIIFKQKNNTTHTTDKYHLLDLADFSSRKLRFQTSVESTQRLELQYDNTLIIPAAFNSEHTVGYKNGECSMYKYTFGEVSSVSLVIDDQSMVRNYINSHQSPDIANTPLVPFTNTNMRLILNRNPNIDVYGVYVYNRALDKVEMDRMMGFLWKEYGVKGYLQPRDDQIKISKPPIIKFHLIPNPKFTITDDDGTSINTINNKLDDGTVYQYKGEGTTKPQLCFNDSMKRYYFAFRGNSILRLKSLARSVMTESNNFAMFFVYSINKYDDGNEIINWSTGNDNTRSVKLLTGNNKRSEVFFGHHNSRIGFSPGYQKQYINKLYSVSFNKDKKIMRTLFNNIGAPYTFTHSTDFHLTGDASSDLVIGKDCWMDLYAIYLYPKALSTTEMTSVQNHINENYIKTPIPLVRGLTTNLPIDDGLSLKLVPTKNNIIFGDKADEITSIFDEVNGLEFKHRNGRPTLHYDDNRNKYFITLRNKYYFVAHEIKSVPTLSAPGGKNCTFFVVVQKTNNGFDHFIRFGGAHAYIYMHLGWGGDELIVDYGGRPNRMSHHVNQYGYSNLRSSVMIFAISVSNSTISIKSPEKADRIQRTNNLALKDENFNLNLGRSDHTSTNNSDVNLYGLYWYNRTLSNDEIDTNLRFLRKEFYPQYNPFIHNRLNLVYEMDTVPFVSYAPTVQITPLPSNTKVFSNRIISEYYHNNTTVFYHNGANPPTLLYNDTIHKHYIHFKDSDGLVVPKVHPNQIINVQTKSTIFVVFKPHNEQLLDPSTFFQLGDPAQQKCINLTFGANKKFNLRCGDASSSLESPAVEQWGSQIIVCSVRINRQLDSLISTNLNLYTKGKSITQNVEGYNRLVVGGDRSSFDLYALYIFNDYMAKSDIDRIEDKLSLRYNPV